MPRDVARRGEENFMIGDLIYELWKIDLGKSNYSRGERRILPLLMMG
jgi:hypothetical protein